MTPAQDTISHLTYPKLLTQSESRTTKLMTEPQSLLMSQSHKPTKRTHQARVALFKLRLALHLHVNHQLNSTKAQQTVSTVSSEFDKLRPSVPHTFLVQQASTERPKRNGAGSFSFLSSSTLLLLHLPLHHVDSLYLCCCKLLKRSMNMLAAGMPTTYLLQLLPMTGPDL